MQPMLTDEQSREAQRMGEMTPLYRKIASLLLQWTACYLKKNELWQHRSAYSLRQIMMRAPSGSGIDCGTKLMPFDYKGDYPEPEYKGGALKFFVEYHHMDENGFYDGWTNHTVTVKASLIHGIDIHISGKDRNGIKEYLADVYSVWLSESVPRWDNYPEDK